MTSSNAPVVQEQRKIKFSQAIITPAYKNLISNTLRDPKQANRFVASITSSVAVNPALQECDPGTILSGALLGESLGLSPSPQLGQYYLVPFNQKEKKDKYGNVISPAKTVATFILGYKGYIQLALRSGYYKKLNVISIKKGEFVSFNPLTEEIVIKPIDDWDARESAPTVGYYAMFEYLNGFTKSMYWSKEKMLSHADHYSMAFNKSTYQKIQNGEISDSEMWKYSSFWYKDFDGMAQKTMLRQLISKWGMMSMELEDAIAKDETINAYDVDTGEIVSMSTETTQEIQTPTAESVPDYAEVDNLFREPTKKGGKVDLSDL